MRHDFIGSICSALGIWSVSRTDFGESAPVLFLLAASVLTLFRRPDRALSSNAPEFLITFNCPIDEISLNFQWFQEWKFLKFSLLVWFSRFVKGSHSHTDFLKTHYMLTLRETWTNCLGTRIWRVNSPKKKKTTFEPFRLNVCTCGLHEMWPRTYRRTM